MQQIYRRITMPKCDFNEVALQLYWNPTSAWVFSCKFAADFQKHLFNRTLLNGCFCKGWTLSQQFFWYDTLNFSATMKITDNLLTIDYINYNHGGKYQCFVYNLYGETSNVSEVTVIGNYFLFSSFLSSQ